jgi:hypothetical protein
VVVSKEEQGTEKHTKNWVHVFFCHSANVRKPRAAHQPPRFRPAPLARSPLRRVAPPPPRAPRRPRFSFHRHRSWQFLHDRLFLWELKELAPMVVPIGWNAISHIAAQLCTTNTQHVVGRVCYTANAASVEERRCPWGACLQWVLQEDQVQELQAGLLRKCPSDPLPLPTSSGKECQPLQEVHRAPLDNERVPAADAVPNPGGSALASADLPTRYCAVVCM